MEDRWRVDNGSLAHRALEPLLVRLFERAPPEMLAKARCRIIAGDINLWVVVPAGHNPIEVIAADCRGGRTELLISVATARVHSDLMAEVSRQEQVRNGYRTEAEAFPWEYGSTLRVSSKCPAQSSSCWCES